MDEKSKSQLSYNIVRITKNDELAVMNFMKKYFYPDEPLCSSISLTEEKSSAKIVENYFASFVLSGLSMIAVSETGDILGVRINNLKCREDAQNDDHIENSTGGPKSNEILKLLKTIQREVDIFGQYPNVNRLLELKCVSVIDTCRNQGICKALYNKTKELALELKCQMMYVECSSCFTAKAVEGLGFKCVYSLSYSDYVNKQGEVVFKTKPPHRYIKAYVLPL